MPVLLCPNCQERMTVAADDLGERVVCPACEHRFVAADDDDRPRGRSRPADRGDDRDFDRPRRKPKASKALWIVLITVGVLVFIVCGGCIGFTIYVSKAKESFTAPWTDQAVGATDGGAAPVAASFPGLTVASGLADAANGGTGSVLAFDNMQQNGSVKDALFLIGAVDYPAGTTNPLDKGYLPIRTALATAHLYNPLMSPRIASEAPITVSGYPAKEAKYMDDDGGFVLRVIHVNDRPKGAPVRLVVVLVGGSAMRDEDKQKFLASVKIGKGK